MRSLRLLTGAEVGNSIGWSQEPLLTLNSAICCSRLRMNCCTQGSLAS